MGLPNQRNRAGDLLLSKAVQGTIMFFAGLGLVIRESIAQGAERPSLYVLYAGMMGLPFFWGKGGGGSESDVKNDPTTPTS